MEDRPRWFQQGGLFGCWIYLPVLGWVHRLPFMLLVAAGWLGFIAVSLLLPHLRAR